MEIHIGKRTADISLLAKEGNKVRLSIDGVLYDVDIVMAENGACSILHNGISYDAELVRDESGKGYEVDTHFLSYRVEIIDSQARYLRLKKGGETQQDSRITSPMPGKVVKITVREGERLEAGAVVAVLEAMKMQSNYKVAAPCVVKEIFVKEGEAVNSNQLLMTVDPIKEEKE